MKRMISVLLTAAMAISLAACGGNGSTEGAGTSVVAENKAATEREDVASNTETASVAAGTSQNQYSADGLGGYKIGFWYLPPTDLLSKNFRDTLDYCAKLTNCEMEYYDMTGWSSEDMSMAVETLVSNGCDGIIMVLGSSPAMYEYLNESEVYYVGLTRSYTDEVALVTDTSEYCTGWIGDLGGNEGVNYQTGYDLTQTLAEEGCKTLAVVGGSEGETMNDERVAGVEAAAKDLGMDIIASYRGKDPATGFSDILASFGSNVDGIAYTGGTDIGVAAIQAAGYSGKIKLAQVDAAGEDTQAYLENGLMTATFGGGSTYMVGAYMQLFNALSGADRLCGEGSKIVPQFAGFVTKGVEEWEKASYCTMGEIPGGLLPDEILSLNSLCVPGMTVAEREALLVEYQSPEYWNIDSIYKRVSEYLK